MLAIRSIVNILAVILAAVTFGSIGAISSAVLGWGGAYVGTWAANSWVSPTGGMVFGAIQGALAGIIGAILAVIGLMAVGIVMSVFSGGGGRTEVFDKWGDPVGYISSGGGAGFLDGCSFSMAGSLLGMPAAIIAGAIAGLQINRGIYVEPAKAAETAAYICGGLGALVGVVAGVVQGWRARDTWGVGSCVLLGLIVGIGVTSPRWWVGWLGTLVGAISGGFLGFGLGKLIYSRAQNASHETTLAGMTIRAGVEDRVIIVCTMLAIGSIFLPWWNNLSMRQFILFVIDTLRSGRELSPLFKPLFGFSDTQTLLMLLLLLTPMFVFICLFLSMTALLIRTRWMRRLSGEIQFLAALVPTVLVIWSLQEFIFRWQGAGRIEPGIGHLIMLIALIVTLVAASNKARTADTLTS